MAPELEMGGGLGLGMGLLDLGFPHGMMMEAFSTSSSSSAPYASSCGSAVGDASYLYGLLPTPDSSTAIAAFHQVDDLLDFSAKEGLFEAAPVDVGSYAYHNGNVQASQHHLVPSHQHPPFHSAYGAATPNYGIFTADHHSSSSAGSDLAAFPDDLYIPSEEAAELEWLSKFVDDSSDVPFHIPGITTAGGTGYASPAAANSNTNQYSSDGTAAADGTLITRADTSGELMIPGRARSKRPRVATSMGATDCTPWLSNSHLPSPSSSSCSSSETKQPRISLNGGKRKRVAEEAPGIGASAERGAAAVMRRCTHCSSEKTPQWRTGPLGPKTLCNACGVRYKSGRLVPEYRPASSPTFVLTQHSNSHRKVMELRRQKEMVMRHHQHQDASPSGLSLVSVSPSADIPSAVLASTRPDLLLRDFQVC